MRLRWQNIILNSRRLFDDGGSPIFGVVDRGSNLSFLLGGLSARRVRLAGPTQLRTFGLTRQKSRYCYELACAVVERRLSVDGLKNLGDAEAIEVLCAQPGIGPWSAAIYLMSALKRIDVWPPGDLALRRSIAELFPRMNTAALADSGDRWHPQRAVAARLIWHHYRCSLACSG